MKKIFLTLIVISLIMISCTKEKVDLIIHNAKVYTVNNDFLIAESFAVRDGKFLEIGNSNDILKKYNSDQVIDLQGKYVYPGLIDAHCHFYGYCLSLLQADLRSTKSFDEIVDIIKEHDTKYNSEWVLGRSWDQNDWDIKEFPTKEKLDMAFPDKPVYLRRVDGHAAVVNSKALSLAGITSKTKIDGGKIILQNGQPTGVLIDNAMNLVEKFIPEVYTESVIKALEQGEQNCFAAGLTSVGDAGLTKKEVLLIDSLQKNNKMHMRINAMLTPTDETLDYFIKNGIYKTDYLNVRSIKLYADGALGSRGAALIEPYSDDPGNDGLIVEPIEVYHRICKLAYENNYQVCTHAIGDSANRLILDIYAQYLKGKNDRRWRIEHAQIVHPDDLHKFGDYSIVPSIQATHCTSDMYWTGQRLGEKRIKYAYTYKELLDQNGWIPNGTDFPVERIEPLLTFYASVARKDIEGYPENGFQIDNALTREETLKSMTIWAAKTAFEENEKGSIEPTKLADFIVLEKDIMEIPESEILSVKIIETYSSGTTTLNIK
ncbi:MAG: amidohydrolase [Bacteroidetes bacterium GWF2_33_16]|nr:MAG: amidohydrolase [Bacteroidetes bacterium GWE2_32_14]OFY07037.1 MAG: amidohydrolase [Bacteroidetes bacterium GWF2_33_16]